MLQLSLAQTKIIQSRYFTNIMDLFNHVMGSLDRRMGSQDRYWELKQTDINIEFSHT